MRISTGRVTDSAATLVELLRQRAERYSDKVVFAYSDNGDDEARIQISYAELDRKAQAIGATLQHAGAAGQRVLVFCRNGFEHIAGFFGCWYAGAIAVPVHEEFPPRLSWVVPDVEPAFAVASPETDLTIVAGVNTVAQTLGLQPPRWVLTDCDSSGKWVAPQLTLGTAAMLMYTSDTTAAPKAVVLSHHNVVANVAAMHRGSGGDDRMVAVCWIPHQHHASLIAQLLRVVYAGATGIVMSSQAFTERPIRWLEAVSRYRGTAIFAPPWAYTACAELSTAAERTALDLSCLTTVACAARDSSVASIRAFVEAFSQSGLRPEVFQTGYGTAETTSGVSIGPVSVSYLNRTALAADRVVDAEPGDPDAVEVLSSGRPYDGQVIVVVDPETRRECAADQVGEIWIAGCSVAQGYWRREHETQQAFGGFLAGTGEGPFRRTGDLGFLRGGELFVLGKCAGVINIGGSRYYCAAVEATLQAAHPALLAGRGAVFTVPPENEDAVLLDKLVVVQEVNLPRVGEAELAEIADAARAAVIDRHGIEIAALVLVGAGALPVATLGRIQRAECRQRFVDRALDSLAEWHPARVRRADVSHRDETVVLSDLEVARVRREREVR